MDDFLDCTLFLVDNSTASKYFNQVAEFLAQYSWIYKKRNTEILINSVLERIPPDWCDTLQDLTADDFQELSLHHIEVHSSSLANFLASCHDLGKLRFSSKSLQVEEKTKKCNYFPPKVPLKKKLEIESACTLIGKVCQDVECNTVIDIGSGLGYLDQILHHQYGVTCIGFDYSNKCTLTAIERIKDDPCNGGIQFKTLKIEYSPKCCKEIENIMSENEQFNCLCKSKNHARNTPVRTPGSGLPGGRGKRPSVMVGLHSCGNLAQDMMKLFCDLDDVEALVCIGCCYNKIDLDDFPMSNAGKSAVSYAQKQFPAWRPCTSGLRLASHGTPSNAKSTVSNEFGQKSLFYRALMEYYVIKENVPWKQPKRHIRPADVSDFETYCKVMLCNSNIEAAMGNLLNLYNEKKHLFPRVKCLLVLQMLLQPSWEGFVTLDRIMYFRERSIPVRAVALWDDGESSRNLALCATKKGTLK